MTNRSPRRRGMNVNNKQRQCALSTTKRILPFFFFAGYFWRAEGFCPPKISKRGHHCGSSSSWTLANTATSHFLHADTPLSVASKINGQEIGIQDEGSANDNKDLMEHIKDLWSYVFNLQKARQTGDAIKPANSLVFYLTQLGEANIRGSEMQDALFHNPQLLIEPLERSLTQAFRAAGDAEDYRLILRLVDASIVYAKRYSIPVLTPRLFGEACHALSQTEVNTSKIKYVWNLAGLTHPASNQVLSLLTNPLGAYELNVMMKSLANRGKVKACIDVYRRHTDKKLTETNNNTAQFIQPDAYTAATLFTILTDSITPEQPTSKNHLRGSQIHQESRSPRNQSEPTMQLEQSILSLSNSACWQWNTAVELLPTLRESDNNNPQHIWNNHVYGALLKLQSRAQEIFCHRHRNGPRIALAILDSMVLNHQIVPDIVTCTGLIKAIGDPAEGSWKAAVKFLNKLKSDPEFPDPNQFSYSAAIVACARCCEYEAAINLLDEMRSGDPRIENTTFVPPKPNTWVYNAALLAISNSDDESAPGRKIKWSKQGSLNEHHSDPQELALNLLQQMKDDHEQRKTDTKPDTVTYNTVLAIMGALNRNRKRNTNHSKSRVLSLIYEMKDAGVIRDSITYRNAILATTDDEDILEFLQMSLTEAEGIQRPLTHHQKRTNSRFHGLPFVFNAALSTLSSHGNMGLFKAAFTLMQKERIPFSNDTTESMVRALVQTGQSSMVPPLLASLNGSDVIAPAAKHSLRSVGFDLQSGRQPPIATGHYTSSIRLCLASNDVQTARRILQMMRDHNLSPTAECIQSFALAYARSAIVSAATDTRRGPNIQPSSPHSLAENAYNIIMALSNPSVHGFSRVAKACAVTGQWQRVQRLLQAVHSLVLSEEAPLSQKGEIDYLTGLHSSLVKECAKQGNVTAALWVTSEIQKASSKFRKIQRDHGKEGSHVDSELSMALIENSTVAGIGMRAEDWVSVVKAASKSGNWRVCVNSLQFLRHFVERTNPEKCTGVDKAVLDGRYEHLATALTSASKCLERQSQYAWLVRIIEDWMEWSGRKPRPEAALAAIRGLSVRALGEEAKSLLIRCVQGGPHLLYSKKGVGYEEMMYIGTISSLHNSGLYDDADETFISAIEGGYLPFDLEKEEGRFVLDLHGMNVAMAHSAVRVAMRQQLASYGDKETSEMMIITGRGRNSEFRMRPVLRPEVQRMLLEEFYPPLNTISAPGNMGALIVSKDDISQWQAHQKGQKGMRMLALAALLKNLSSDRLRRSIALTVEASNEKE